jgi:hypothetical protein
MFIICNFKVDWEIEIECFDLIAQEIALLYRFENGLDVERILFPAIKCYLTGQTAMLKGQDVIVLSQLSELYKIFERC